MTSHSDKGALPDPAPLSIKIEEDTAQPTHTNPGGNGMPLTGPRLPSQADPQEDKSTLQLVLHLQHQDQQPGSDEKALQIVHGPLPEGLQQDPAEQQPGQYQAQGYGHAGAPLPAQQPDPSGQAWGQQAYAPQGYGPPPAYPPDAGAYAGMAYGADQWQWQYPQRGTYPAPAPMHMPVPAWGYPQPPPQQMVPLVAMVDQYGQQYLPAYPMAVPGQMMQPPPPGRPPGGSLAMQSSGGQHPVHSWPSRAPPRPAAPAGNGHLALTQGRPRNQRQHGGRGNGGGSYGGHGVPECININRRITACRTPEELLSIVHHDLDKFDSVCMATCVHTLANLRCSKAQYHRVFEAPEMTRLMAAVSAKRTNFTARNLANLLWGLAKVERHPGEQMLGDLAEEIGRKIDGANAQNLANIAWAFATLVHSPGAELLEAIAREAEKKITEFTAQNISNLVYAFAKLEHMPASFLSCASGAARTLLTQFTPQALSNTVWAFSKLEVLDAALFAAIAREATGKLPRFNAQNIANTVWGFANINFEPGEQFWLEVGQNAIHSIHEYSAQNIANVLWSYAKMGHQHGGLLKIAAEHAVRTISTFQPQSVANLVWAYATLGVPPEGRCLDTLAEFACRNLHEFSPQNISNSAWAMATLQYKNMHFLVAAADEVTSRLASANASTFSRQHLANLIWAYATLEVEPKQALMKGIAAAMAERAADCNPQEISNCVWAFARLKFYDEKVMDVLADEAQGRIKEFSQQNLANVAWALGKLSHYHKGLLNVMAEQAASMVKELSLQHISNILWAYVSFLEMRDPMAAAFLAELRERLRRATFNAQQLSNLLWSLCIAEMCTEEIWQGTMEQITKLGIQPAELPEEALTQIYQAHLLMMVDKPGADLRMPGGLLQAAHTTWLASARNVRVSALHREVSRLLADRGVPHTIEHLTDDHLFSVDIALPGERIAFEVDGPHHFTANTLAVTGEMLARQKLLAARGWHVVSVPFFRWAGRSDEARAQWLLQELHLARESQAKAYGLSWGSAASAPPLPPGGPAVYGLVADASLQGRQAEYAAWHARARLPAAPYPELKADANPHIPGPVPPPHPPPGAPAVSQPAPPSSMPAPAQASAALEQGVPLPPPSTAVTVSFPGMASGETAGAVNAAGARRKRSRSPEESQDQAKRSHVSDVPGAPSHLAESQSPSHVPVKEQQQCLPSTSSPASIMAAVWSQASEDATAWRPPKTGSGASVTQLPQ